MLNPNEIADTILTADTNGDGDEISASNQTSDEAPAQDNADNDTNSDGLKLKKGLPKYLVLANAMFWRDPDSGFELSWTTQTIPHSLRDSNPKSLKALAEAEKNKEEFDPSEGNWWIKIEDIPQDQNLLRMLNRAVTVGNMELTDDYAQWLIDKQNAKNNDKGKRKGLIWSELDIQKVKDRKQIPRSPSIARGSMTYSDKDSKAYKILQEPQQNLKSLLPKLVGALPEKDRPAFLQEALSIERAGYNRAAQPRVSVVDLLIDLMGSYGISSGIGLVSSEQEPITKNVKPLKIPIG